MLSVIMLSVIMLSAIMLSVIMLSVMEPIEQQALYYKTFFFVTDAPDK